ncbi:hypothetical protein PGB90_003529 [Kerria lacca]
MGCPAIKIITQKQPLGTPSSSRERGITLSEISSQDGNSSICLNIHNQVQCHQCTRYAYFVFILSIAPFNAIRDATFNAQGASGCACDMFKREKKSAKINLLLIFIFVFTTTVQALESVPYGFGHRKYGSDLEDTDPEVLLAILARLGQSIMKVNDKESKKRGGLDLGLSRGYSGSQQAKHMMGIAAAGLLGGPGRRRRSENTYPYRLPY